MEKGSSKRALEIFSKIKDTLQLLSLPNFESDLWLTTDASAFSVKAVLSQDGRKITIISRILSKSEGHYATNEKQTLSIICSLNSLIIHQCLQDLWFSHNLTKS